MNHLPTISIIIPVYNGEKYITDCLHALMEQTQPPHEIIVVDDGSTDRTPTLILPPAKIIQTSGRTGAGAARNLGAKHATGEILLFTDADVVAPPEWVEKTQQVIKKQNVRCGGGGYCGPVKDTFIQWFAHEELVWRRKNFHGYVDTLVSNNLFCNRQLFLSIGGFPETYRTASSEDMEFSWLISRSEPLWWESNNGVFHNFTPTLKDYLKQQKRFAIDAIPMVFNQKKMLTGNTHHPRTFYLEILFTGLIFAGCITTLWNPTILIYSLIPISIILFLNTGLLTAMKPHDTRFLKNTIFLIFMRNLTILYGACIGIYCFIAQREK